MHDLLDQYLSVNEVAEILRKAKKTVYRYLALGLPSRKIGQTHLIRNDELVAWIEARRVGRVSPFRRRPTARRPC
jgi:excisionase family DNA binding protein